ncbi:MAG: hypothetical protein ABSA43_00035 [Candidatus Microgenomates bacterium]|jgi:hypothetical protein
MLENKTENPFSREPVEEAWILQLLVNQKKTEALQVMRKARIVERFTFNFDQMVLFNLGMAKYMVLKSGRDPMDQAEVKVPIILKIFPSLLEYLQKDDEAIVKALTEEIKPYLDQEVKVGEYLPGGILDAANNVSSSWFESQQGGEDFLMAVEKRTPYLKNVVLRKRSS